MVSKMHSTLLFVACFAGCSLPELALGSCDTGKCSSTANDCCAPAQIFEAKTCTDGYVVHDLSLPCEGYSEGLYTCCEAGTSPPPEAYNESGPCYDTKCNSNGNDCCAPDLISEPKTCLDGYEVISRNQGCHGYAEGYYSCCEPGSQTTGSAAALEGTMMGVLAVLSQRSSPCRSVDGGLYGEDL
eukprot:CAMPEP_0178460470 /NCGR_PEP_ID=MMETSP0689_2-20121128/48730_1 /TAXON_ID=160604 /ORGANISM="Amphidinium massartii, Strain CS-259" /LENGTH=184 /DNA_ID=CAMNT_0020087115 /DNA_START=100 /DNA_END=655 /DNA_ORIENTATION=+